MSATLHRLFLASLLRRRLATALSLLAIALGVALGLAVQLIHTAAIDEFGRGMRLIAGEADLQLVGPRDGFDEAIYPVLAARAEVAEASRCWWSRRVCRGARRRWRSMASTCFV